MKKILFVLAVALLITVTACAPSTYPPIAAEELPTSQPGDFIPNPADSHLVRENIFLDSTDLLSMESYPLQFTLVLNGNLPTPCHKLRIAVSLPDTQNKIIVDVYSVTDPEKICTQVLQPFKANFPLGSFPTGHYTLWVNGEQVAEFDS